MSSVELAYAALKHNEGEHLDVLGDRYCVIATGDQTEGAFAAVEVTVSPGNGAPPHVDNREAIGWYVLEGTLEFMVEGEEIALDAGGWIYSPKGVLHTFHNSSDAPARALLLAVPSGLEGFFREVGRTLKRGETPRPPTDEDVGRVMAAAPRYGIDIPPPPA